MVGESVEHVRNEAALPRDAVRRSWWCAASPEGVGEGSGLRGVDLRCPPGRSSASPAWPATDSASWPTCSPARPRPAARSRSAAYAPARDPRAFRAAGVVSVAADPLREFVVPGLTVAEHAALWRGRPSRSGAFESRRRGADRRASERAACTSPPPTAASPLGRQHPARPAHPGTRRALTVLVVSYPTRGLDVLTTETTRALLLKARDAGSAVLLISEDLDELLALSDRIAVLAHGHCAGVVAAQTPTASWATS